MNGVTFVGVPYECFIHPVGATLTGLGVVAGMNAVSGIARYRYLRSGRDESAIDPEQGRVFKTIFARPGEKVAEIILRYKP